MAVTDTDLNDVLTAIRPGADIHVVRQGVALMLQVLIDAEATARDGAGRGHGQLTHHGRRGQPTRHGATVPPGVWGTAPNRHGGAATRPTLGH